MEERTYSIEELRALKEVWAEKNDPASTALNAQVGHGPLGGVSTTQFGVFSDGTTRPGRWSALERPRSFISLLGAPIRSELTNEIQDIMTGQTAGGTTNAASFAANNPPTVGELKTMQITSVFGRYYVKSKLSAIPEIGQLKDYSETVAMIMNQGPRENPLTPDILFNMSNPRDQRAFEFYKIGIDLERTMEVVAIRGEAATDNSRTGWFQEFAGLDSWIKTGYRDAVTNVPAPAADSVVESFNVDVAGTDANGRNIAEALNDTLFALRERANRVGMGDTTWAIVMRMDAFRRITDQLAYLYATAYASGSAGEPVNTDGMALQGLRNEMRNGRYLLIDGLQVPVILTEGIARDTLANQTYKSDIYFVPLASMGRRLTYIQYFPIDNQFASEFAEFGGVNDFVTINNGMYIVGRQTSGLAKEYLFGAKFRLICEVPFLAGRLDDVWYTYYAQTRDALPGASLYVNGGVTYRS